MRAPEDQGLHLLVYGKVCPKKTVMSSDTKMKMKMMDTHLLLDVILGPKFKVWGWGSSVKRAKVLAVKEIVGRARQEWVLAQACSLNLGHPDLLLESSAEQFFATLLDPDGVTVHLTPPLCAPTLFSMLKWKSIETGVHPLIKRREVIAFCNVPLKRYARVIGRCLQLLVKALYLECTTLGFPLMLGTCDFSQACIRLSSHTSAVHVCEQDMQDMYWEIPKVQVLESFNWAVKHLGEQRKRPVSFFAIHRGGDKILDRLGKGSEDMFWNVPVSFVLQYVSWELYMNTIFTLGPLILEQGSSGVPIGGCLSAPKSELWAMWREHMSLSEQTETFQQEWQEALDATAVGAVCVVPGPGQFTPLSGQGDFVRFSGIWAHRDRQQAPDRSPLHGHTCPASGFWAPSEQLVAWVHIDGWEIPFIYSTPWDGAALGRTESILRFSPRRDKRLLTNFFSQFTLADFVIHEIYCPNHHTPTPIPCVLLARFKDNVPMAAIHVPEAIKPRLFKALECFLKAMYQIGLKWENHGDIAQLCECEFVPGEDVFLRRKGIVPNLQEPLRHDFEWQRWLPVSSPNAKQVLTSTFPSLLHKSLLYCCNLEGFRMNVRSLVWGAGWHRYPPDWWKNSVKGFLQELKLVDCIPFTDIDEGKEFRGAMPT